jgi:hypothetical protein
MSIDLSKFTGGLPYDSQLYGIYQPLLGWRSQLQMGRLADGLAWTRRAYLWTLAQGFSPQFEISSAISDVASFELTIAQPASTANPPSIAGVDGLLMQRVASAVKGAGGDPAAAWQKFTSRAYLGEALAGIQQPIRQEFLERLQKQNLDPARSAYQPSDPGRELLASILTRESVAAGVLAQVGEHSSPAQLAALLSPAEHAAFELGPLLNTLDPAQSDMAAAALSPIGVVHLFRQYFFEFATFLGPPVQHVWLSPGGTVELIEVSTRRTLVERTLEQALETVQKTETDTTTSDELSQAVKQENASDTKLGVSATSNTNYNTGFVNGSVTVAGSFSLDQQQKQAREQTHKTTRQQTQKLSSEIRQNYKSTLRTVTETTDTSSKRYALQNTTENLVNYELRRKMRQVGVQLQDYGTRLCWQAYVDTPGDSVGMPIFVHAAPPPDLQDIKMPEAPPAPAPLVRGEAIVVKGGWDKGNNKQENFIPIGPPVSIVPPAGYLLDHVETSVQQGPPWAYRAWPATPKDTTIQIGGGPVITAGPEFIVTVGNAAEQTAEPSVLQVLVGVMCGPNGITEDEKYEIALQVTPVYRPTLASQKALSDTYNAAMTKYSEQTKQAYQQSLFQSIRERVKLASDVQPRSFNDLREEERIVVYRSLVTQLLGMAGVTTVDPHVRHVFSEVVESMFDMDNMLYFVAPDWWMPRPAVTASAALSGLGVTEPQDQGAYLPGSAGNTSGPNVVGWGGPRGVREDNYYITEDSTPAKLGSSLGWLLELDGDNFRNAFLNAPWVKAVIPIQEGHEWKALDWLSSESVEGADGLEATYQESFPGEITSMLAVLKAYTAWPTPDLGPRYASLEPSQFTILDAIRYLIVAIQAKQAAARTKDPKLNYLPTDQVYERGFDPLAGGFVAQPSVPFEVFDEWIEVLPTDQIVPVEVAYDPQTGQQK